MNNPNRKAWLGLIFVSLAIGLLLFITAGTIYYWQAWIYLAFFFGFSFFITLYLMRKDPALLARRVSGGPTAEKRKVERIIMVFASLGFIALLVIPALDRRRQWSQVPYTITIMGYLLFVIGWIIIFFVYRENSFASATIEVAGDQKVISTGPYAIVRHPMYAGALLYCFGTPLALGSYWGLLALAFMMPFLLWRLLDEEKLLSENLPGYAEYCKKVRWRLMPGVF
jgi:protein-S-isoprenylcysteine O-methyltransferase Ste14